MKRLLLLSISLLVLLSVLCSTAVVAAAPEEPAPEVSLTTVTYGLTGIDVTTSAVKPGSDTQGSTTGYGYSGYHWASSPVSYYVNPGSWNAAGFKAAIDASFAAWNGTNAGITFNDAGQTTSTPLVLQAKWNKTLGTYAGAKNVVGWKKLTGGTIGITYIWSYAAPDGRHVIEVDTALNSSTKFKWYQNPPGETWTLGESAAYDVDIQNIMTHEAGHWLVLNDLYDSASVSLTMYGYAGEKELNKRSLENGDVAGIEAIY